MAIAKDGFFALMKKGEVPTFQSLEQKNMKKILIATAIALSLTAFSASALQVSPLYKEHLPTQKAGVLKVVSGDAIPKTYQVTVEEWVLENGKKVRRPSTSLRFVPTIFTVQPKASQTVRWVHQNAAPGEHIYRIKVQELADPKKSEQGGVSMLIAVDFPWLWRPQTMQPQLAARWDGGALIVRNSGNATAQLTNLVAGTVSKNGLIGYVLPGEEARFEVGGKAKVPVSIKINGKDIVLDAK